MCVIIQVEPRKTLPQKLLQNCYDINPDGWGIMTAHDNKLEYVKETKDFNAFYSNWKEFDPKYPRAIHFRRKTSGLINQDNCHPFFTPEGDVGFMHNGVLKYTQKYENMNDTYHFMMDRIAPWVAKYPGIAEDPAFYELLEEISGSSGSKFLFLTRAGQFHITNKTAWVKNHGCMFSNPGVFNERKKSTSTTSTSSGSVYDSTVRYPRHGGFGHNSGDRGWWHHGRNYSHERGDHDYGDVVGPVSSGSVTRAKDTLDDKQSVMGILGSPLPAAPDTKLGVTGYSGNIDRWEKMVAEAQLIMNEEQHLAEMEKIQKRIDEIMGSIGQYSCDAPACQALDTEFEELSDKLDALKKIDFKKLANDNATPSSIFNAKGELKEPLDAQFEEVVKEATTFPLALPAPSADVKVGEVLPPEESDAEILQIFKNPSDIRDMPKEDLFEWADEYPFAAAQCLLMFAGRA